MIDPTSSFDIFATMGPDTDVVLKIFLCRHPPKARNRARIHFGIEAVLVLNLIQFK
jgi:hypothetical protein